MNAEYDRLVQQLYAGILSPEGWRPALMGLRCLTHSEQVTFLVYDRVNGLTKVSEAANFDPSLVKEYESGYYQIDPVRSVAITLPRGTCFLDRRHLGDNLISHNAFYQDFLRRHGLSTVMCSVLYGDEQHLVGLAFQGGIGRDPFADHDALHLKHLMPHLMNAARLRLESDKLSRAASISRIMLDSLAQAVFVINGRSEVVFANRRALSWLSLFPPGRGKQNTGTGITLRAALEYLCVRLCGTKRDRFTCTEVKLADEQHRLLGFSLSENHPLIRELGEPAALVLVKGYGLDQGGMELLLRDMFRLTPAEARIAAAVQKHERLSDLAQHLNITHETARTHLKSIFEKTGCHSQTALRQLWEEAGSVAVHSGLH